MYKQQEGTLIQVIPNYSNDNETVEQIISLIHDAQTNKMAQILSHKKEFLKLNQIKKNIKIIIDILKKHPNVISYEIYSDFKITCFNFWIPKHLGNSFTKEIYKVWDGSKIQVYEKDYVNFDLKKTQVASIRFASSSILPVMVGKETNIVPRLITHLENIELDEKVLIQILMKPIGTKWQEKGRSTYKKLKQGKSVIAGDIRDTIYDSVNKLFSSIVGEPKREEQEIIIDRKIRYEEILSKLSQRAIQLNIRVAVQSNNREGSNNILNGILNAFKIMEGDEATYNTFIRKDLLPFQSKEKFIKHMAERRLPIITINSTNLWITPEISNFLRMPDGDVESNKISRINIRQTFVPDELKANSGVRLGKHSSKGIDNMLYWDVDDLDTSMRPVIQISNPGEGKSVALINRFLDWVNLGYGAAVMDVADGKVIDQILYHIYTYYPHLKEKVVLIDCNDLNNPPGLSDFSEAKNHDRSVSQMLTQLWTEFYINFFGIDDHHRSKDFIRKSSMPIFHFPENTILEQYLMISNEGFRQDFLERIKPIKRLFRYYVWWKNFDSKPFKVKSDEIKAILNKFDVLIDNDNLKNIICQKNPKIPKFRDIMDDRKIVLIKAGEGAIGYETSRMVGALVLMKFWMAALSRHDIDEDERMPFKFFGDEPQNYIASGNYVEEMLNKSRKYRFGLEFFFQDPEQIESKDKHLLNLMLGTNPNLLLGKMGVDQYKKYFKDRIFPLQPQEGPLLPKHHWIVSIYKDKNPVPPFIVESVDMPPPLQKPDIQMAKTWIKQIKDRYTKKVSEVEDDIQEREMKGFIFESDEEQPKKMHKGNATMI